MGFFVYDLSLCHLAHQQLRSCLDSCALAAGATNASSNSTSPMTTQTGAIATAMNMFSQNTILGQSLSGCVQVSSPPTTPAANKTQLYFQFLDPITKQPVPLGSTNGKIIQVTGGFGFVPSFAKFIGLALTYPVIETSNGGLPMLDIVLCFDTSASMDDFTQVSIVNRYNLSGGQNGYSVLAQGPLYQAYQCTSVTGVALNATFPQSLDSNEGAFNFSAVNRGTNNGAPAPKGKSTSVTDVVVNIDGTDTMSAGVTINSNGTAYIFPANNPANNFGVGVLVEAARGNLESITVAKAAGVPYTTWGITPKAGYYAAYHQGAMSIRHPIQDAIQAAQNFFTIMNNDCDLHIGLVTFSTAAGSNSTQTDPTDSGGSLGNITDDVTVYKSNAFPTDPFNPTPPNPGIMLNPSPGPTFSNYSSCSAAIQPLLAYGSTNIAGALQGALNQMKTTKQGGLGLARTGATKAIILFTDGLPTVSSLGGDPAQDARAQALAANQAGIPVYCIGLCLTPGLLSGQSAMLTDQNSNPTNGGIAGISGNGAAFYQATKSTQLSAVFENVARALVQLVH
jgi:hypothetical protein